MSVELGQLVVGEIDKRRGGTGERGYGVRVAVIQGVIA